MSCILLVEGDPTARLARLAALGGAPALLVPEPGEDAVRALRRLRPGLVLVGLGDGPTALALRPVRSLVNEPGGPIVAILDALDAVDDPAALLRGTGARGYLGAPPADAAALRAFLEALERGESPVHRHGGARGLRGWLRRWRRG